MKLKNITKSDRIIYNKIGKMFFVEPGEVIDIEPKNIPDSFKEVQTKVKRRKSKKLK